MPFQVMRRPRRRRYRRRRRYQRGGAMAPYHQQSRVTYRVPSMVRGYRKPYIIEKMRFAINGGEAFEFASTTGSLGATKVFRANDVYDPYQTGGGSQPRGFDQLIALYRNFVVLGSKCVSVWSYGTGASTSATMQGSITLKDGTTALADVKDVVEHIRTKTRTITAENDRAVIVSKYSWRLIGAGDPLDNENLYGTASSSPTEQYYYHFNGWSPTGGSESIWLSGYIDYTVIFFHGIQPASS